MFTKNYQELILLSERDLEIGAIYLLNHILNGEEISLSNPKIKAWQQTLHRKLYLKDGKITDLGKKYIEDLKAGESEERVSAKTLLKDLDSKFEEWWEVYPATNNFIWKGHHFQGIQSKRKKKSYCKELFSKCLVARYDADDIIRATKYHFEMAKELSYNHPKKDNQISFINNTEIYLRDKLFEPYIEVSKNKKTEKKSNIIDI